MDAVGQVVSAELVTNRDTVDLAIRTDHYVHSAATARAVHRVGAGGSCTGTMPRARGDIEECFPYIGNAVIPMHPPTCAERHCFESLCSREETVNNFVGAPARELYKLFGNSYLAVISDTNVTGDSGMVTSKATTNKQLTMVCTRRKVLLCLIIKGVLDDQLASPLEAM